MIDCSCSMRLDPQPFVGHDGQLRNGGRMERAKAELARSIQGLAPGFGSIACDCTVRAALIPAQAGAPGSALLGLTFQIWGSRRNHFWVRYRSHHTLTP